MSAPRAGDAEAEDRLRVEAEVVGAQVARVGGGLPVRVTVTNDGPAPCVVNARLSPGYHDSMPRELFAEIVDAGGGEPAAFDRVDYDRDLSTPEDYVRLEPGEHVAGTFDLLKWYPIARPGRYRITLRYQADEPMAHPPPGTVRGVHSAVPVEVVVG